jgi:glycosyltransferase involved in cell wall biosynthesis
VYHPNTAESLAETLSKVLADPARLEQMSRTGRKSVEGNFDCRKLTKKMVDVYEKVIR